MTSSDVEADWLPDTLREVARRLRRPGVDVDDLAWCADQLERIVADLQPTPVKFHDAGRLRWGRLLGIAAVCVATVWILRWMFSGRDDA